MSNMIEDITNFNKIKTYIDNFSDVLDDLGVDKTYFKKNKETLRVIKKDKLYENNQAQYLFKENQIELKNHIKDKILHELIHMSSTYVEGDIVYSGFSKINTLDNKVFGIGLNEAFTALLDELYFSKGIICYDNLFIYPMIKDFINIIDLDFFIDKYFKADMRSVVNKISLIVDLKTTNNLLDAFDKVYLYGDVHFNLKLFLENYKKYLANYAYIFLVKNFKQYYNYEINGNILDFYLDKIKDDVISYYNLFGFKIPVIRESEYRSIEMQAEDYAVKSLKF